MITCLIRPRTKKPFDAKAKSKLLKDDIINYTKQLSLASIDALKPPVMIGALSSLNDTLFICNCDADAAALQSLGYSGISISVSTGLHYYDRLFLRQFALIVIIPHKTPSKYRYVINIWGTLQHLTQAKIVWLDLPLNHDSTCLIDWLKYHLCAANINWQHNSLIPYDNHEQISNLLAMELENAKTIEDIPLDYRIEEESND